MKNLRMSSKLLICFMAICLLMVMLGSVAYYFVRASADESQRNLELHLPAIDRAHQVANHSLTMIAEMRSFAKAGRPSDYDSSIRALNLAKDVINSPGSAKLQDENLMSIFRKLNELYVSYENGMIETSATMTEISAHRAEMVPILTQFENELGDMRITDLQNTESVSARDANWWRAFARAQRATREKLYMGAVQMDPVIVRQAIQETESSINQLEATGALIGPYIKSYYDGIVKTHSNLVELLETEQARSDIGEQIITLCNDINAAEQAALVESGKEIMTELNAVSRFVIFGLIVCLILSVITSIFLARAISRPLEEAVRFAETIAAGDYTQQLKVDRSDEIGDLGSALNSVSSALQLSISSILDGVNVLASSVAQILTSTSQMAASASETAASVSETSATVEEVKQTGILSNEKSQFVAQAGRNSTQSLREGERAAEQLTAGMDHIREQTASIAEAINRLSENSRLIGEIITSVDEIAEQSNILAVNAAIEAAKAGEQGRGFAVVAREIRNLSEQSKRSTSRVRGILTQIESGTSDAVRAVHRGNEAAEQGRNFTRLASQSIQDMRDVIQSTSEASAQIAAMSQQQVIGMDQATLAMTNIKQASHQTADSMRQLESAAQSLRDLGERLRELATHQKV